MPGFSYENVIKCTVFLICITSILYYFGHIGIASFLVTNLALTITLLISSLPRPEISGIPQVASDSVLGYSAIFNKPNLHEILLNNTEIYGGIYQYVYLGYRVVVVTDMLIAKNVLRDVTGKGFFHRPSPNIQRKNVLNMDTNDEWKSRRQLFSRCFSQSALKKRSGEISNLVEKFITKLKTYEFNNEAVPIDLLFSQLTIDIISIVGFQYNIDAMQDSGSQ